MAMDRNLALELVCATEAAALSCARLMGRGDEWAADQSAVGVDSVASFRFVFRRKDCFKQRFDFFKRQLGNLFPLGQREQWQAVLSAPNIDERKSFFVTLEKTGGKIERKLVWPSSAEYMSCNVTNTWICE